MAEPESPDLGSFLVPVTRELEALGHEVEVASISRRGGLPTEYASLVRRARGAAKRTRPDVVFAHFLFPAGAAEALAARTAGAPLVVMAHGQDVANLGRFPGVTRATAWVLGRSAAVIANSRWLADRLIERIPVPNSKISIADCGVDLDAFTPPQPRGRPPELGWDGEGPAFLCVGSLIERKNVIRLADAFASVGRGGSRSSETGPCEISSRESGGLITGRIPQSDVPEWVAACDVLCQPSLREPFGQATLEGWRWSERSSPPPSAARPSSSPRRPGAGGPRGHRRAGVGPREAASMPPPTPRLARLQPPTM